MHVTVCLRDDKYSVKDEKGYEIFSRNNDEKDTFLDIRNVASINRNA